MQKFKLMKAQGKRIQASLTPAKEYVVTPDQWSEDIGAGNRIIGPCPKNCSDVRIVFQGRNNILYLEKGIRIMKDTTITFSGDNAVVFLCSNLHDEYSMDLTLETDSLTFIGRNVFLNSHEPVRITAGRDDSVFIGDECLFAQGIQLDTTSDYPSKAGDADAADDPSEADDVNAGGDSSSGDIYIGNHVWVGQDAFAGAGTKVNGGAIIGARTILAGVEIPGNTIWATKEEGLAQLRENVMYAKVTVRNVRDQDQYKFETVQEQYREIAQRLAGLDHSRLMDEVRENKQSDQRLERLLSCRKAMWFSPLVWDYDKDPAENHQDTDSIEHAGSSYSTDSSNPADNRIAGSFTDGGDVEISFAGKGNILYIEDGVTLKDSYITFHGDNAVLYLAGSKNPYRFRVSLSSDSLIAFGRDCKFNDQGRRFRAIAGEGKCILIGNGCKIRRRVWVRTSDQHPIYDLGTGKRINAARDIIIGDGRKLKRGTLLMKKSVGIEESDLPALLEKLRATKDAENRIAILKDSTGSVPRNSL